MKNEGESAKITVAALRKELHINSWDTASNRLKEAVETGAIEEDDSKRKAGKASRYFWLLKNADELRAPAKCSPRLIGSCASSGRSRSRLTPAT